MSARLLVNLLIALGSILLSTVLLELGVRAWQGISNAGINTFDLRGLHRASEAPGLLYELRPGAWRYGSGQYQQTTQVLYRINAQGLRDKEYSQEKPPGVFRIAALGDSITFGYGVAMEESYPKVLEAMLNEDSGAGARYEVINFGVGGYNAEQEAIFLKSRVLGFNPDLVLVGFVVNDGWPPLYPERGLRGFLTSHSALYNFALPYLKVFLAKAGLREDPNIGDQDPSFRGLINPENPTFETPQWKYAKKSLRHMMETARQAHIPIVLVALPMRWQERLTQDEERQSGMSTAQELVASLGEREKVPVVDPLPYFRQQRQGGESLFLDELHPTTKGHHILARVLLEYLRAWGLLK